jgi:glycosyltransferase involved in cell wall biosynthesis
MRGRASLTPDPRLIGVAHVVLGLRIGGLERVVVDLVNHSSECIRPIVICLEKSGPMAQELRRPDVPVLELDRKPGLRPWLALRIRGPLRRHGVRIAHTHNSAAGFYGGLAGRLASLPVVHTKHGLNLTGGPSEGRLNGLLYRLSDQVVAVSESARELARAEGARDSSLMVVDNGIDLDRFEKASGGRAEARAALGIPANCYAVGTVARLVREKCQEVLISAFARLTAPSGGGESVLVLVGGGPLERPLREQAAALGVADRVLFTGPRTDVACLLAAFDVFALPSVSEGLPVALLEAMAAGIVPVVTRVGAMPEVVVNAQSGLVIPPRDVDALAQALASLRNDAYARNEMGRAAAERVRQRYGARRMALDYEAIYARLLQRASD